VDARRSYALLARRRKCIARARAYGRQMHASTCICLHAFAGIVRGVEPARSSLRARVGEMQRRPFRGTLSRWIGQSRRS
jgi:hypothetical protein